MNLHYRTVQGHGLDPDTDDLSMLQPLEQSVQHAALGPAVHARIDRMPVAKALWQAAPLAAVFGYIQNGIENLKIRKAYVASLPGQTAFDLLILSFGDFHTGFHCFYTRSISEIQPLVLTRPRNLCEKVNNPDSYHESSNGQGKGQGSVYIIGGGRSIYFFMTSLVFP